MTSRVGRDITAPSVGVDLLLVYWQNYTTMLMHVNLFLFYRENKTVQRKHQEGRPLAWPCPQNGDGPALCDCLLSGG